MSDDPRAQRQLFDENVAFVWRTLRHLGARDPDVEDLTQEVFIAAFRKVAEFEGRSTMRTWLYGICRNVVANYRRRAHLRYETPTEEPPDRVAPPQQLDSILQGERLAVVDAVLGTLSDDAREVFILYEIEQMTMSEVAEAVGCPLQTAYSRLHAARKKVVDVAQRREKHDG